MEINYRKIVFSMLLLAIVAMLTGTTVFAAPSDCNGFNALINPGNTTTNEKLPVTVTGGANKGTSISCTWSQETTDTKQVTFNHSLCELSFTAPEVDQGIELHFSLSVTAIVSLSTCSDSKSTKITIQNISNQAPTASATATPATVDEGGTVTLNGSASSDPDGNSLTYTWTQVIDQNNPTTPVLISNSTSSIATFTAPAEQYPNGETLTLMLTVSDGSLSGSTTVNVTVKSVNQAPTAAISPQCPISVNEGAPVTLDGSGSSDPDQGVLSYQWSQDKGIPNADLTGVDLIKSSMSFTAPQLISSLNTMKFGLKVTDNGGLFASAECDIVVLDITPPSIDCVVPDQTSWYGNNVTVNCTASDVASGLADSNDASFTLTTNVSPGTETDSASTGSKQVCDQVGNCATAGPYTFKVDKKAPTVSCGTADTAWHAIDQSVTCTATDGGSGPASQTVILITSVTDGTETSNASTDSKSACDNVGHCATAGPVIGFMIDKKAPQLTSCDASDGQWHNGDVTLKCHYTDGGSGPASQDVSLTTSVAANTETASAAASANGVKACDNVGNCAASPSDISGNKIDKKAPQLTSCDASDGQWHNGDVTLKCHYTDGGSGPASQDVSLTTNVAANTETASAAASANGVKACDNVGNCAASPSDISGNKIDKKAPTNITFSNSISDGGNYYFGFVPTVPTCSATDNGSGLNSCDVTGYNTNVGSHTLTATAKDNVGNQSTATLSYTVLSWTLKGFYQPVDMPIPILVYNTVKNGSTVPLKFEIFAGSTELTDTADVPSLTYAQTNCDVTAFTDDIETISTGGTVLRYDATAGQFIYNWKTPTTAGKCYRVTMTTLDGSSLAAYFKLK